MVISLKPYSRGRISLSSRNPLAHPRIEARYLSDERDMAVMVDGVRAALGVNRHMAAAGHSYGMYELDQSGGDSSGDGSGGPSDDEIRQFIRANAEAAFHPTSSCSMGPASNKLAVVDERLRVHGVRGLRVVDLSVVPTSPRGHTAAVAIAVGEMASDFIIQDRLRAAE
ncbi:glucose-methanol-choline oxidoreductase [Ramicandelaber brevisporus]|nr:glucose-methanol-choline oxidoreductase [Ramicandelaber brevisporus]